MDKRRVGTVRADEMEILHWGKIAGVLYSLFSRMSTKIQPVRKFVLFILSGLLLEIGYIHLPIQYISA